MRGAIYETCGHEAATLRDYGAGGFALVCDPCDAESEASLLICASSVCGDCDEDLMGGGPHAAGCPGDPNPAAFSPGWENPHA